MSTTTKRARADTDRGAGNDPLVVIDRLEVGPVKLEPRRLSAAYTVVRSGGRDSTELIYRFEEDVFDDSAESRNLAAMIAAQVALNYGLFCKRLVFHGPYDYRDEKFLGSFAENTAREIYVNKFLMPNPFLTGSVRDLPAKARQRYSRATIEVSPVDTGSKDGITESSAAADPWGGDRTACAVLSSGGKDSLLTLGVVRELGLEAHPVFVNESGRHWYTALNAFRHLEKTHAGTTRVWTNSDRVFTWMLRHLPFIRKDFSRIRSDEYPIRLWTVAVFAFGALPLLRKRGIGHLLIGDEHDTTVRKTFRGITHYHALFDQSRYFDDEMTRYFGRKGWGVCQYSILRPLSELLVQKILAERYPDLHRHQVSCHAAHIKDGRVLPCGKCEKCRRIVGMLKAVDADPARCGYTAAQVDLCLKSLAEKGIHQEEAGARHLAHELARKGLVPLGRSGRLKARPHPEVMALRFHRSRSPVESVPTGLRGGVFRILVEHVGAAVIRNGRVWTTFDPLSDRALSKPYAMEASAARRSRKDRASKSNPDGNRFLLGELTWPEAEARFRQVDVALLPVGAVEQHGPHLPLDTDAFDADHLAKLVADACSSPKPLVLPLISYGVSYHHEEFSGTLSVSPETQARLVHEVGMGAARCGITKLVIINGHGGNAPALHLAAQMINRDAHIFTCVDTGETSDSDIDELIGTPNDVHAGEIETSTTLAVRPSLVKMAEAPRMIPRFSSRYLDFTSKRSVGWYAYTKKLSKSGVMGDATKASAEKGERMWALMTQRLVELVEDLKSLSLDEIYQRRY